MSLSDLASFGTFVGGVAVALSLVYLGIQTRQNTKHTRAQISQSRAAQVIDFNQCVAADRELSDIFERGMRADPTLSPSDLNRFYLCMLCGFLTAEDHYQQHLDGLIEEARHQSWIERNTKDMQLPGYRAMWNLQRSGFDTAFRSFMDDLAVKGRTAPLLGDLTAAWEAAVAAERLAPTQSGHSLPRQLS